MRLLVSVRSAVEAAAALAGGADIVDAKEPRRGSLGPVDGATLREIVAVLPPAMPFSVALGECDREEQVAETIAGLPDLTGRLAPIYLKLGLRVATAELAERLLRTAVTAALTRPDRPAIVAAAYADHMEAHTPPLDAVTEAATRAGVAGVLVDTHAKDGRDLLSWMSPVRLGQWVGAARSAGLLTGVAGSLRGEALSAAAESGADVVGVRGAACHGGRDGILDADLVRTVRRTVVSRRSPKAAR